MRKAGISRKFLPVIAVAAIAAGILLFYVLSPEDTVDLQKYEANIFSQGGEDGILEMIFSVIEPSSKYLVEFGCSDGVSNSNSRNFIVNHGWSGLLMDGDGEAIAKARSAYRDYKGARIVEAWIYPGNVEDLFEANGVPRDLDLLSIDIDSNDYYVWRAIHDYRPKVVLIEFNASFPPPEKAVVKFHPMNYWDKSDYYGASIQSLYELGKRKGYELIYCTSGGVNLVFVDKKYYRLFGIENNDPKLIYREPGYGIRGLGRAPNGLGWPRWDAHFANEGGEKVKPFKDELTWDKTVIPKSYEPLPYSNLTE